ncbi:MAG: hypothetical protein ACFWT6_15730 [Virgibacillus proomii]
MNRKFLIIIAIMLAIPLITLSFKLVKSVAMIEQEVKYYISMRQ